MKTTKNLLIVLFTLFMVNSFSQTSQTYSVYFSSITQTISCHVGDVLEFYGNQAASYVVNINGITKIVHNSTTTPYLIGSYTVSTGDSTFEILNESNTTLTSSGVIQIQSTSGIKNISVVSGIKIFPNPVIDILHFESDKNTEVKLFTITGELIMSKTLYNSHQIDLSELDKGMYMIQVDNGFYKIFKE